jgi:hypothetical protein
MTLAKVEQLNLGLSASAVAVSYAVATPHFAISLAAGALLEALNLGAILRAARRLFSGEMLTTGWVGVLSLRFVLLAVAIYVTMQLGVHPIAFVVGLSIVMPATLIDAWWNRPPIIDPAELPVLVDDLAEATDEDGDSQRLWSTGHLFTSESISELPDRADRDAVDERDR